MSGPHSTLLSEPSRGPDIEVVNAIPSALLEGRDPDSIMPSMIGVSLHPDPDQSLPDEIDEYGPERFQIETQGIVAGTQEELTEALRQIVKTTKLGGLQMGVLPITPRVVEHLLDRIAGAVYGISEGDISATIKLQQELKSELGAISSGEYVVVNVLADDDAMPSVLHIGGDSTRVGKEEGVSNIFEEISTVISLSRDMKKKIAVMMQTEMAPFSENGYGIGGGKKAGTVLLNTKTGEVVPMSDNLRALLVPAITSHTAPFATQRADIELFKQKADVAQKLKKKIGAWLSIHSIAPDVGTSKIWDKITTYFFALATGYDFKPENFGDILEELGHFVTCTTEKHGGLAGVSPITAAGGVTAAELMAQRDNTKLGKGKILVEGAGEVGFDMVRRLIQERGVSASQITIIEPKPENAQKIRDAFGVAIIQKPASQVYTQSGLASLEGFTDLLVAGPGGTLTPGAIHALDGIGIQRIVPVANIESPKDKMPEVKEAIRSTGIRMVPGAAVNGGGVLAGFLNQLKDLYKGNIPEPVAQFLWDFAEATIVEINTVNIERYYERAESADSLFEAAQEILDEAAAVMDKRYQESRTELHRGGLEELAAELEKTQIRRVAQPILEKIPRDEHPFSITRKTRGNIKGMLRAA